MPQPCLRVLSWTLLFLLAGLLPAAGQTGTFQDDVLPILTTDDLFSPGIPACSGTFCHGPPAFQGGLDLTSYAGVMAGGDHGPIVIPGNGHDSSLRRYMRNNRMPFGVSPGVPENGPNNEVWAFHGWIQAGASETESFPYDSDGNGTLDAMGTYLGTIRPLLDTEQQWGTGLPACTNAGCHDAVDPVHGLDLSSYAAIMAGAEGGTEPIVFPGDADNSPLIQRMRYNRMPYGVPTSVPRNGPHGEVDIIVAWIDAGAPEFDPFPMPGFAPFIRGDANRDSLLNVADAIAILQHVFSGVALSCHDAADGNDDGTLDVADAVYILSFLFSGGSAPPPPYPVPGIDPTADALDCVS